MKSKTFVAARGRMIEIVIDSHISFQFPNEGNREFYWIEKDDFVHDSQHWLRHLSCKNLFSEAMANFLNESLITDGNSAKH